VAHPALGDKSQVYISPLHIELSLKKLCVKAMEELSVGVGYLRQKFPSIHETKLQAERKNFRSSTNCTTIRRKRL
jgi:hypothetical protein